MSAWTEKDQCLYELKEIREALIRFLTLDAQYEEWAGDANLIEAREQLSRRKYRAAIAYAEANPQEIVLPHDEADPARITMLIACLEHGLTDNLRDARAILAFAEAQKKQSSGSVE